jgi:hypothetical protein
LVSADLIGFVVGQRTFHGEVYRRLHADDGRTQAILSIQVIALLDRRQSRSSTRAYRRNLEVPLCPRCERDERLKFEIGRVRRDNFGVYGIEKIWHQLNREGTRVSLTA